MTLYLTFLASYLWPYTLRVDFSISYIACSLILASKKI
jgi:hypothetical protein